MTDTTDTTDPDLRADVHLVTGGQLSPDSVGPEEFQAVVARVRAAPDAVLAIAAELFLGAAFDPVRQATQNPVPLLEMLRDVAPDKVRAFGESLLRAYDGALVLYDGAPDKDALLGAVSDDAFNSARRLDKARRQLRRLLEAP